MARYPSAPRVAAPRQARAPWQRDTTWCAGVAYGALGIASPLGVLVAAAALYSR